MHRPPIKPPLLFVALILQSFRSFLGSEKEKIRNCPTHPFYCVDYKKHFRTHMQGFSQETLNVHMIGWKHFVDLLFKKIQSNKMAVLFISSQVSFCIRKERRPLHLPLRSTSASGRTGQTGSPRRKSSSLSRFGDEIC